MSRLALLATGLVCVLAVTQGTHARHDNFGCSECHVMHRSAAEGAGADPLWSTANTADGLPVFTIYSSERFDALNTDIGQPDGASRLCLGCHDGSYGTMREGTVFRPGDLAGSHPVSFTYDSSLAQRSIGLKDPTTTQSGLGGTITRDLLDGRSKVQCSSCHDMHTSGVGKYMLRFEYNVASGTDVAFCRTCHNR